MSNIDLKIPVTNIKLVDKSSDTVFEVTEFGKLNQKKCKEVAKSHNAVFVSKTNEMQSFTVNPTHLEKV